jgi:D-hydroxyproline dehydrogenase subunit alpha
VPRDAIAILLDGRPVKVAPGATVAVALWNAGISAFRISVTGEPRGPVCGMGICFECRVTIDGVAHRRACLVACAPGMVVETAGAPAPPLAGSLAAAKTVRFDVAVVGAGPAGLAAACRAAEAGASVLVLDEAVAPGGQVWRRSVAAAPGSRLARRWLRRFAESGALLAGGASVLDVAPGPTLLVDGGGGGRALRVEARRLVIATGARERFLPFPGWTLPNVVGIGGAQALLKGGAGFRGRRVVVAGTGPLLLPVAAALARAGARIALVAEQAPATAVARFAAGLWRGPRRLAQAARCRAAFWRAPYRCGVWVTAARGPAAVREAILTDGVRSWSEECDVLACAYGLVPNLELARLLGCALGGADPRAVRVDALQQTSVPGVYCAGEPTGIGGLEAALLSGQVAGLAAAGAAPETPALRSLQRRRDAERRFAAALERAFQPRAELLRLATPATIVCRCEDVALGRIDPGWSARQAKLYTRAGMGPCQGRVCGPALELLLGWDQLDTVRPPLTPVALATLAELADGDLAAADSTATHRAADPAAGLPGD